MIRSNNPTSSNNNLLTLPKLQLLSGHAEEKSLAMYRDLALADVSAEYEAAMQLFPVL
jgi:hypothetical protein